jgi:uncharacterized repeat protein (TIGR03803 family)
VLAFDRRRLHYGPIVGAMSLALGLLTGSGVALADTRFDLLAAFDTTAQNPVAPLIQGNDGNLYGTTSQGGAANAGTIFRLTPAGTVTVLYTFTGGADGAYPYAGLLQGTDGNFYGTTSQGGAANAGTVFQLTPAGVLTILYAFSGTADGAFPYAGVIQGTDGNFYGSTSQGGVSGAGTIFQLTPSGALTVLYAFTGVDDGAYPYAGVVQGTDGNFYGTTYLGGVSGAGTVFQLTPVGTVTVLYAFTGGADGAYPYAGVIVGVDGNLYGTTSQGGANSAGAVFQLLRDGTLNTLHAFAGGVTDGAYPVGSVIQGSDGDIYGTTLFGGSADSGTVFQVTPAGAFTILYAFTSGDEGAYPYAGVVQASDGHFYGTSAYGGAFGGGTAFRVATAPSLVTWNTPAPIVYGTPLSAAQLNATASVPGVFAYTPPEGTVLHGGPQTLTVSFTPDDTTAYAPTTSTVTLTVTPATPVIRWTPPAAIVYGTALSRTQLSARANVAGTFAYDPPAGAVPGVGVQTLSATFTPANATDYATTTGAVTLTVTPATPMIAWTPAAVAYGMALGPAQLNASANTPGTFVYVPPAGTVLDVGVQTLTATFTPADSADYTAAAASATVTVAIPGTSGGGNEYPLQFTPASGARGLVVAGYALAADPTYGTVVIGNCSYYTVHSGSGRGGGYRTITTYFNQTCTWDSYGNLLSVTAGAPAAPPPLSTTGTQTIYASNPIGIYAGSDSALPGHGFVYAPGPHYAWLTPNPYTVVPQALITVIATLTSNGDIPLSVSSVQAAAVAGQITVTSTTCSGEIPVGSTCSVTIAYDPTRLRSTTGLAYDTLSIHVNSDAGQTLDFVQRYTILLTPGNTTDND